MKMKLTKGVVVDIIMGIVIQIFFFFPWIRTARGNYSGVVYLLRGLYLNDPKAVFRADFPKGFELMSKSVDSFETQFHMVLLMLVFIQIVALIALIQSIRGRTSGYYSITGVMVSIIVVMVWTTDVMEYGEMVVPNRAVIPLLTYIYPSLSIVINAIWFLAVRIVAAWDEATKRQKQEREQLRNYERERRRRLYFPGKYTSLYYRVLWKELWNRRQDVLFLLLAGTLSTAFLFIGMGVRSVFTVSYGEDNGMLGLGLVSIMRDFIVVIVLVSFFLVTVVLSFYRRRRLVNAGLFDVLGVREKASFVSWIAEVVSCFVLSIIGGLVTGRIFLAVFRIFIHEVFPEFGKMGVPDWKVYLGTIVGMFFISLFAFGISHDMQSVQNYIDARGMAVKEEPLPGKYSRLGLIAGLAGAAFGVYLFRQRKMGENILVFAFFLVCAAVVLRNAWGIWLKRRQSNQEIYLKSLVREHMTTYRFRTTVRYVSLFAIVNICALFFFTVKLVSNQIAEEPETRFPYDYMYMANDSDNELFDKLKEECMADIYSVPMVRVTTVDNSEQMNDIRECMIPQGQNIGISESTYRELKKLAGETAKESLGLDRAGNKIYIVYQQDKAVKAHPIDWFMFTSTPYVHIGQPVDSYNFVLRPKIFVPRTIVGEEINCLTGCFRQGAYENLIVFSDPYFEEMRDDWKTTDINTGRTFESEASTQGADIHQGPTQLNLVNVPKKNQEEADHMIEQFRKNHSFDESFDPLVKSAYSKTEAIRQRTIEHLMESMVNGLVIGMLLLVSIFLLHIKVKMELQDLQKQYQFMECFGMKRKERIQLEKQSVSKFVWYPLGLTIMIVPIFTAIVFKLRLFQAEDMTRYAAYAGGISCVYVLVQVLNLIWLQHVVVRKVEGSNGK